MSNVNKLIIGENVTDAWIKSISFLKDNGCKCYNLIVEIENPILEDIAVKKDIDTILLSGTDPEQQVETVANTIFPKALDSLGKPREELYQRFHSIYPLLRKVRKNQNGTYFGRLVSWGIENGDGGHNQLEQTITKLEQAKRSESPKKVRYEMSIYNPIQDGSKLIGFPCMSFISIKIRGNSLDMTVMYRNQFFGSKAYGNYLGLGRLLDFICRCSDYEVGKLTCIATHADLEGYKRPFTKLIEKNSH